MLCEMCGGRSATVHVREVSGTQVNTMHLCTECAEAYELIDSDEHESNGGEISIKFDANIGQDSGANSERKWVPGEHENEVDSNESSAGSCPACGWTEENIQKQKRLGCTECYNRFWSLLKPLLEACHKALSHKTSYQKGDGGRHDGMQAGSYSELENELNAAIASEDYERAAELRDLLDEEG